MCKFNNFSSACSPPDPALQTHSLPHSSSSSGDPRHFLGRNLLGYWDWVNECNLSSAPYLQSL